MEFGRLALKGPYFQASFIASRLAIACVMQEEDKLGDGGFIRNVVFPRTSKEIEGV